jgi:hypothetical protein
MATATTRTRSRSRGRPASKASQPAKPLNRIRTNAYFSDPDYDQTTPMPKTASTPSPTWGKTRKNNNTAESPSTAPENSRIRLHSGGGFTVLYQEEPTVSLFKYRNYNKISSFCAPVAPPPTADFQDSISKSNLSQAKAMASPTPRKRSSSRPKRVEISSESCQDEEKERMRSRASPIWRKKRPDTPTSARGSIFGFPSKHNSRSSLDGFVPKSGFIWLVLILLGILLGLTCSPKTNSLQVAYKEVYSHFGNPSEWKLDGKLNFTIDDVVSHCYRAADAAHEKFGTVGAKTNIQDLLHTCQSSIDQTTGKLEDIVKSVPANLKKSLCYLPGAETWHDCAKKPISKLSKTLAKIGSVITTPFGSTSTKTSRSWSLPSKKGAVQTVTVRKSTNTPLITETGHAGGTVKSVVESFASEAKSYATSKLSSASSAYLPFTSGSSIDHHTTLMEAEPSITKSSMSNAIDTTSEIKDLELRYTLAVAKAELKMLQANDTSIITHTTYTKRHLNRLLNTAWSLQEDIGAFELCVVRETEHVIHQLSRKVSQKSWTKSWVISSIPLLGQTVISADKALRILGRPPVQCRKSLVRMNKAITKALQTREGMVKEIDRLLDLSYRHDFRKRGPLYIPVPLPWFRALGPFPHLPVIPRPSISLDLRDWFLSDDYWYRRRSQEQREESLKLHRLRMTLHRIRNASNGFGDIKPLIESGLGNLTEAHNELQSQSEKVLKDPEFGIAFFKGQVQDAKKDRALAVRFKKERKRVREQINADMWNRYDEGNNQYGEFLAKEMRT